MTKDFSDDPIEGEEARSIRKMHHEWTKFQTEDVTQLKKVAWVLRNYKVILAAIALGAVTNIRDAILKVMGGGL